LEEAESSFGKWGFKANSPTGKAMFTHMLANKPIEWNRIGVFQDVTLRLIAERLVEPGGTHTTYVEHELMRTTLTPLPPPGNDDGYHIYCSENNTGAVALIAELVATSHFRTKKSWRDGKLVRRPSDSSVKSSKSSTSVLNMTTNADQMGTCDHMLLYLTSQTWTQGERSTLLADELRKALDLGVDVLLAHEMVGGEQEARFGCEFALFFSCVGGATPGDLLKRGIYSKIAVPLKGGPWREVSMVLLCKALGMSSSKKAVSETAGWDVLGLEMTSLAEETGRGVRETIEFVSKALSLGRGDGRAEPEKVQWGQRAVKALPLNNQHPAVQDASIESQVVDCVVTDDTDGVDAAEGYNTQSISRV